MSEHLQPQDDSWIAAIHRPDDERPFASGVVLDDRRVLTCAHVLQGRGSVYVSFPRAEGDAEASRYPVERMVLPDGHGLIKDVAILVLDAPVPVGVIAAPLRCPKPADLVSNRWWAFGFPVGQPLGNTADGQVGGALGHGWVRLDTGSRYPVASGFSGGGLWSPDYQAVVAIVGQANDANGDGLAVTLHQVNQWLPDQGIRKLAERAFLASAGDVALLEWGWSLATDVESRRHWRPRARGVSSDAERGHRFRGRTAALRTVVDWLDRDVVDRRVLVVTGNPGAGKSAVLGRIVTTADPEVVRQLPESDTAVRATLGSVACAVHAKGLTALEVARQIAAGASAAVPERIEDFAPALRDALTERSSVRFNIVIDALDEAASPAEARLVILKVVTLLAETCGHVGAQVVVGTRRADVEGDLLASFGGGTKLVDLDEPEFFAEEDLAAYSLAALQLAGDARRGSPYAVDAVAIPVANRIAALSDGNFLVAGLTARTYGLYDEDAADPMLLSFSPRVDDAMREYLTRIPPIRDISAETLLTALAFAESPGLPLSLWRVAVQALGFDDVPEAALLRFARSSAAGFLVESSGADGADAEFRLFHQALNDALLRARNAIVSRAADERALARALTAYGREAGWQHAPEYLLRSLPRHAQAGGMIDDLLGDDAYLLHADLHRLLRVAADASSPNSHRRAQLLRLTPQTAASPSERAAMFSVTEAVDNLGTTYMTGRWEAPYHARWASTKPRTEHAFLESHQGEVRALCTVTVEGGTLLATGGKDGAVQLWDWTSGQQSAIPETHRDRVAALCAVTVNGRELLASGGIAGQIRLWDPASRQQTTVLESRESFINALCAVTVAGRKLLASGNGNIVRLWDPASGEQAAVLKSHRGRVKALCAVTTGGRTLIASGGDDRRVLLWDPISGEQAAALRPGLGSVNALCTVAAEGSTMLAIAGDHVQLWNVASGKYDDLLQSHTGKVQSLCSVTVGGRTLLASGGDDGTIRLWDPATRSYGAVLKGHQYTVTSLCSVTVGAWTLLASGGIDDTVRLWDPASKNGTVSKDHPGEVGSLCSVTAGGRTLLASGSDDGTVQLWDLATGKHHSVLKGHSGKVRSLCLIATGRRTLLASSGEEGGVRLWDPVSYKQTVALKDHPGKIWSLCSVTVGKRSMLASGSDDGTIRLWDPASGRYGMVRKTTDMVIALCSITAGGRTLLASGGHFRVHMWDPVSGEQVANLEGHHGVINALCSITAGGRTLLASGGEDGKVLLRDPVSGEQVANLEGHHGVINALCSITAGGRTLLASSGDDRTVRIWDPLTSRCAIVVPVHRVARAMASVNGSVAVGLDAGILVMKLGIVTKLQDKGQQGNGAVIGRS